MVGLLSPSMPLEECHSAILSAISLLCTPLARAVPGHEETMTNSQVASSVSPS